MTSALMSPAAMTASDVARPPMALGPKHSLLATPLRVPLLGKVLGANLLIVLAAVGTHLAFPAASTTLQLIGVLALSFIATAAFVWLALRPIAQLEAAAERVSGGDFNARVPDSKLADRDTARLAQTMNRLLDRVATDRARIHYLAGRSVRARDIEREFVARELRDSFAQTLAGIGMQLSAAGIECAGTPMADRLGETRGLIEQLTEEMRSVAETLYPGTLGAFGLVNAVEALARRVSRRSTLTVEIDAGMFNAPLSGQAASALYRVADEALRNVEQHAQASHVRVILRSNGFASIEIDDDGRGLDMRTADPMQAGLGLFSAKAVLALAGGEMQISSAPGLGTRVYARVPVEA